MPELGMDVAAVRDIANRLDGQAQAIASIMASVDGQVRRAGADWWGENVERFSSEWYGRFRLALQAAHDSVSALARAARVNANQQVTVSNPGGARGVPVAGAGVAHGAGGGVGVGGVVDWIAVGGTTLVSGATLVAQWLHHGSVKRLPLSRTTLRGAEKLLRNAEHNAAEFKRLTGPLDHFGRVLDVVGIADDIATHQGALATGLDVGTTAVSMMPEAALPMAAFQTGWLIGNYVADVPAVHNLISGADDAALAQGMDAVGGNPDQLVKRYSGWSGPVHFGEDVFSSWFHGW